jgi:predicted outer membrane protein
MQYRRTQSVAIATAFITMMIATACSNQPPVTTATPVAGVAAGNIALYAPATGMWVDRVGGVWMDTAGAFWSGADRNIAFGLRPGDVALMNNANIVAHLTTGDSLEVALSQIGVDRARDAAVRDFARRMVTVHAQHIRTANRLASDSGVVPLLSPVDTAGAILARRMMNDLSNTTDGASFDRRFMRAEVVMHQHMLNELEMTRSQGSGVALQLVNQTIPVVRQHLADARMLWQQVGGNSDRDWSGSDDR